MYQADVSEDYGKEDPEDIVLDLSVGGFVDSVGGYKTDDTGNEGVTDVRTK